MILRSVSQSPIARSCQMLSLPNNLLHWHLCPRVCFLGNIIKRSLNSAAAIWNTHSTLNMLFPLSLCLCGVWGLECNPTSLILSESFLFILKDLNISSCQQRTSHLQRSPLITSMWDHSSRKTLPRLGAVQSSYPTSLQSPAMWAHD